MWNRLVHHFISFSYGTSVVRSATGPEVQVSGSMNREWTYWSNGTNIIEVFEVCMALCFRFIIKQDNNYCRL
jgi:hypothetical protein